jgi:hypothetical protein
MALITALEHWAAPRYRSTGDEDKLRKHISFATLRGLEVKLHSFSIFHQLGVSDQHHTSAAFALRIRALFGIRRVMYVVLRKEVQNASVRNRTLTVKFVRNGYAS